MANSRLLNKQISLSEKVADLPSDTCRLLYTWLIPHTDDFGVVEASPRKIKALVFPMNDCTVEDIGIQLESIEKAGLLTRFQYGGKEFFYMNGFTEKQTLKKDRQPQTILEFKLEEDREKNWKTGLEIVAGIQMVPNGIQSVPEVKLREDKLREDNHRPNGHGGDDGSKEYGNENVNQILNAFKELYGFSPTDKYPRKVAHNLDQQLSTLLKKRGKDPKNGIKAEAITAYFKWVSKQEWAEKIQNLDTVRRKLSIFEAQMPEVK